MYFISSQKVAVLVFASLAGVTLFLFQNCSAASQIVFQAQPVKADDLSDVLDRSSEELEKNQPIKRSIASDAAFGQRFDRIIINDHQDVSKSQKRINDNKKKSAQN